MKYLRRILTALCRWGAGETCAFSPPGWVIPTTAAIIFLLLFLVGEAFFRVESVQQRLTGPRIGSSHRQFEEQIARLEKLKMQGEPIDCIFLGNSMIWLGINPLTVNQAFQEASGYPIHCFNFGISALPASSAGYVAQMLVNRYQPKLLVYGTFARDFNLPDNMEDAYTVTGTPWLRYINGQFNLTGWLYDQSYLLRYRSHVVDVLFFNFRDVIPGYSGFGPYHDYGFDPKMDNRVNVQQPPAFNDEINRNWQHWLSDYPIQEENLAGLHKIIGLEKQGVEVVLVEMPMYPTGHAFFTSSENSYDSYIQEVERAAAAEGVTFWRTTSQPQIPVEDWWDYFHLTFNGAEIFSDWIGASLAEAALLGQLPLAFAPQQ